MSKIKDWLGKKLFWLRTGVTIVEANKGRAVEQIVIRHGNYWFMINMDAETGDPTGDFGWSQGTPMTHVPIKEHYRAVKGEYCNTACRATKCVKAKP